MNIILLGMPGSGKGTQAESISEKYHITHVSTGDIFREILNKNSSLAEEVKKWLNKGYLVPDGIVFDVVKDRLGRDDCKDGFLLDGFPRNINQAETFDKSLESSKKELPMVVYLELSVEVSIRRLASRRLCPACKRGYNLLSIPPARDEECDDCKVKLVIRKDDEEATVKKRVKVYGDETAPLIDYYSGRDRLLRVQADNDIESVFKDISSLIDKIPGR